jgi:beta-galactosidase
MDLAGFPKDVYYLYQSVWTDTPVLHLFPHWNWKKGQTIDVWAYYNDADEVELYLNGQSQGVRRKQGDEMHVMWRLTYEPGTLKAVSRKNGKTVLVRTIRTAGPAVAIRLTADRKTLQANGQDMVFIKAAVIDSAGNRVPDADNRLVFGLRGPGSLAATNNGYEADTTDFSSPVKKAYNGLCLAVVRAGATAGSIVLKASSPGLAADSVTIRSDRP